MSATETPKSKRSIKRAAKWRLSGIMQTSRGCENPACRVAALPGGESLLQEPTFLHWDHLDPTTKKGNVSDLIRSDYSWATILTEIAKCRSLCGFCHALHSSAQRNGKA